MHRSMKNWAMFSLTLLFWISGPNSLAQSGSGASVNAYRESPSALNSARQLVLSAWPERIDLYRYQNNYNHPQFASFPRMMAGASVGTLDMKHQVNGGRV
jgi:hypothetical protein